MLDVSSEHHVAPTHPNAPNGVLPLSSAQQRLWSLEQQQPGASAHISVVAARLVGILDLAALRASLDTLTSRHEALRTIFRAIEGRLCQLVALNVRVPLTVIDLRGVPSHD